MRESARRATFWLTSPLKLDKKQQAIHNSNTAFAPAVQRLSTVFSQVMKLKAQQLEQLSSLLVQRYRAKDLIVSTATDDELKASIAAVIGANFAAEEAIENEARQMLAAHAVASRDMDPYKMFLIAKQKLAAKKGFIL
jgi:hypothetical protein